MTTIRIEIKTSNAAFAGADFAREVERIFRDAARKLGGLAPGDDDSGPIIDTNGNSVGRWYAERDEEESDA